MGGFRNIGGFRGARLQALANRARVRAQFRSGLLRNLGQRPPAQVQMNPWQPASWSLGMNPFVRTARLGILEGIRQGITLQKQLLNTRLEVLNSIDNRIRGVTNAYEAPLDQAYVAAADTGTTTTTSPSSSTTTTTDATSTTQAADQPSYRTLANIFEELDRDDFTEDQHLPKKHVVDDKLADRGFPPISRDDLNAAFYKWSYVERYEKREKSEGVEKEPTQKALFAVFEILDSDDFTEDEPKFPLVESVNSRLKRKGFSAATRDEIHRAYRKFKAEEEEEEEPRRRKTRRRA